MIQFRSATTNPSDIKAILDFWMHNAENNSRPTDTSEALISLINRDPDALILAIGKLLVNQAVERFKTFGGTRIDAMILDDNEMAHKAWASYGFVQQDNWSRWVKNI